MTNLTWTFSQALKYAFMSGAGVPDHGRIPDELATRWMEFNLPDTKMFAFLTESLQRMDGASATEPFGIKWISNIRGQVPATLFPHDLIFTQEDVGQQPQGPFSAVNVDWSHVRYWRRVGIADIRAVWDAVPQVRELVKADVLPELKVPEDVGAKAGEDAALIVDALKLAVDTLKEEGYLAEDFKLAELVQWMHVKHAKEAANG